jgi:CPA2 family monovalent cation:H+ antiporter-2
VRQHVIIAGFGPIGRVLADALRDKGHPYTVIEMNPATVRTQQSLGCAIIEGDASDPAVLERAGIVKASALAITLRDSGAAIRVCQAARKMRPVGELTIAIRTRHLSEAFHAKREGADIAVIEEIETAKAMANVVAEAVKLDAAAIETPHR